MFFPNVINRSTFLNKPPRGSQINDNHPLARGLYACYLFNELSGETVHDLRRGQIGRFAGTTKPRWHPDGIDFDGNQTDGAYIDLGTMDIVSSPDYTSTFYGGVCIILHYIIDTVTTTDFRLLAKSNGTAEGAHWFMLGQVSSAGQKHRIRLKTGVTTNTHIGVIPVSTNQWTQIALNYRPEQLRLDIFTNGEQDNTPITKNDAVAVDPTISFRIGSNGDGYGEMDGRISYVYMYNRGLSDEEIAEIYRYPYSFIKTPILRTYSIPSVEFATLLTEYAKVQVGLTHIQTTVLRPVSDVSTGGWTSSPLYEKIDEVSPDDNDLISSSAAPSNDTCEVALTPTGTPSSYSDHNIRYRYQKNHVTSQQVDLTFSLYQGTTLIAEQSHADIPSYWTIGTFTLTTGQAASITNYSDLRIRIKANKV